MTAGGPKTNMSTTVQKELNETIDQHKVQEIDSKYRLIILAAQRSKQLQRGARPRIDIDATKHKPTRVALEEVLRGMVPFHTTSEDDEPAEE